MYPTLLACDSCFWMVPQLREAVEERNWNSTNIFRKSVILEIVVETFLLTTWHRSLPIASGFIHVSYCLFLCLVSFPACSGILEDHTDPQMRWGDEIGPFYPNCPISAAHSGPILSWKPILKYSAHLVCLEPSLESLWLAQTTHHLTDLCVSKEMRNNG